MKLANFTALAAAASGTPQVLAKYVWPSQHDFLEDLLAMQGGYLRFGFTDLVVPCGFGSNRVGIQNAAQWVRTAFHDFATHDKAAGTGGLDASIMYELDRAENEGSAFNDTFADMNDFLTPRSSVADLLALSVVASVASCGGPRIPLRAGRVDAVEAGPAGVPKPEDSLDGTTQAFARAGFNVSEMIALVACGHTLGGVHSVDFPQITGGEAADSNVPKFDGTSAAFDTAVVDEYLSGTGANPLVFGANDTTNSDGRVFGADGNATMRALADAAAFASTCAGLLARMIDAVPSAVALSDPIEPADVKPYITALEPAPDGSSLSFAGRVRVRTSPATGRPAPQDLAVALDVLDRAGANRSPVPAARALFRGGTSTGFFGEEFAWFEFDARLDGAAGIRAFDVRLTTTTTTTTTGANGTAEEVFDNAGTGGFPAGDGLLFAKARSCIDSSVRDGNMSVTVVAAVREDLDGQGAAAPVVKFAHKVRQVGVMLPRLAVEGMGMEKKGPAQGGYVFYEVRVPVEADGWSTVFDIVLPTKEGELVSEFHRTNELAACEGVR